MTLYYVPLELYHERYTEYQSSKGGVYETAFKKYKIPFKAIRPHERVNRIKTGVVLDAEARSKWAFEQSTRLVQLILNGTITSQDVIHFEDFWHPGMEMIPYAMSLKNVTPQIFSFWHAQSVDPYDFTYPMRTWMRSFETAWARCHSSIFVASPEMKEMIETSDVNALCPIEVVGLPYSSSIVRKRYAPKVMPKKKRQVVFSSRWDKEKCPEFFCHLAEAVMDEEDKTAVDTHFHVCTGAALLRSNDAYLLDVARKMRTIYPSRFHVHENLSKKQYFKILAESKVQFNCADQDFISLTILDATTMGCLPLYPDYLTFPTVLENRQEYLYEKNNLQSAKEKLYALLNSEEKQDVSFVYKKQENTVARMLYYMGYGSIQLDELD